MFNGSFLGGVRLRGLGQAQIRQGAGFQGPFGIYSDIGPAGGYTPPSGFPSTTQEEIQTYVCPDGTRQNMTRAEAMANGCKIAPPTGPYAKGPPPLMAGQKGRFLGQVNLVTGPSATPFYAYPPSGYFANPSGSPLMTPEITSPQSEHIAREYHCMTKDGKYTSVPMAQRDMYIAQGWEDTDYNNCGSPPHAQPVGTPAPILSGRHLGQGKGGGGGDGKGGGGGAPATSQSVAPGFVGPGFSTPTDFFAPPLPGYPGYYPTSQPGMTCKKVVNKDTGEETFDCVPKPEPAPSLSYRYPVYFMNPFFY